jgi:hypothetical protein
MFWKSMPAPPGAPPNPPCGCARTFPPNERAKTAATNAINSFKFFIALCLDVLSVCIDYDTSGSDLLRNFLAKFGILIWKAFFVDEFSPNA